MSDYRNKGEKKGKGDELMEGGCGHCCGCSLLLSPPSSFSFCLNKKRNTSFRDEMKGAEKAFRY